MENKSKSKEKPRSSDLQRELFHTESHTRLRQAWKPSDWF